MEINSLRGVSKVHNSNQEKIASDNAPTPLPVSTIPGIMTNNSVVMSEGVPSKEEVSNQIEGLNKWLQVNNTHLKFQLHEKLNEYYVSIVNEQTNEVIREIPSKKILDMVAKIHEMVGLLVDEKR